MGARSLRSTESPGCVPGTARILKGEPIVAGAATVGKSLIQPDGGKGCSGMVTGFPVTVLGEEAALETGYRKGTG